MDLVILTKQFGDFTGATVSTIQILKRISRNFNSVKVFTLKAQQIEIPNVKIIIASNYIDLLKKLMKEKNAFGYSDDHLGFLFYLANIRYVHTYHGNWPDARWLNLSMFIKSMAFIPMYKLTIKKADKVVSVSNYMKEKFIDRITSKSVVIFNGVKQKSTFYERKGNHFDLSKNNRFIMVGNLDARKYRKAVFIFKILNQNGFKGTIDIYGKLVDKKLACKLSHFNFVNIKGAVKNIDFSNYRALLCTSSSENLPVSIVEATLSSVFVISFNVGGISEVIKENVSGKLFDKNDYYGFAKEVMAGGKHNVPVEIIRHNACKFNWDNSAKLYEKLFKN